MRTVLTIAGSDPSGGAGIQADLKTISAHGHYGMSVITALTAQNTGGVYGISEVPAVFVGQQLDCVLSDIPANAVKIGMVHSSAIIHVLVQKLMAYGVQNLVLDPVMISTSGRPLLTGEAKDTLMRHLMPLAMVITPNIPEAACLSGIAIETRDDRIRAAEKISTRFGGHILIKGGHGRESADDMLYWKGEVQWFTGSRINNKNTHGTGCTLSSAIACNLAAGHGIPESVGRAKQYINNALMANLDLGHGNGPLNHCVDVD